MSPANNSKEDVSIHDDAELLALEKLLCNGDEEESVPSTKPALKIAPTLENAVPRLRDDSSFADAFSYDLQPAELKAAEKAAKTEDLDSSDDEEVKNFLERKYNQYGSDINKKLKQQREVEHETKVAREVNSVLKANSANKNASNDEQPCHVKNPHKPLHRQSLVSNSFQQPVKQPASNVSTLTTTASPASAVFTDPVFGLRIINPLISSNMLVERMSGRKSVPLSGVAFHIERGDLSKDWVIAGVVVSKLPVRTSKKGDPYSTWRISDLRGDIKMASLFLFRDAHKSLWKTAEGMCLAVLNPSIFEKRAGNNDVACLSIDNAQKVMILGQSKDFGMCRATKKNGDHCTAVVNLTDCDYCVFHIKQEYGKMSRRSELQSATSGRGLNELRNKVLGKNEVFYGGQSFSAVPAKKSAKLIAKDRERLSMLSEYAHSPFAGSVNHQSKPKCFVNKEVPFAPRSGPISRLAGQVEVTSKQRLKDLERIKLLKAENDRFKEQSASTTAEEVKASLPSSPPPSKSTATPQLSTPTSTSKLQVSTPKSTSKSQVSMPTTPTTPNFIIPDKFKGRLFSSSITATPKLSKDNFCLELNVSPGRAQAAKLKAAQVLKKRPIEKVDPNSTRGSIQGKRRAVDDLHELLTNSAKRHKIEEEERESNRKSRIERIMAATSSHKNLVDLREQDEQSKYFDKLEKKEAMEEKMLSTFKIACKAVICQRCKYTAFSAAERCKQEQHPLKVVDAEKRFFQCKDCGNRTTTVFKLPKLSCSKCKGSQWVRTAMIRERKIVDGSENLSIRGDEETFLGSSAGGGNLNLLVPDEEA